MSSSLDAASTGLIAVMMLFAQPAGFPNDLDRWYVAAPPEEGTRRWFKANENVEHEWMVFSSERRTRVKLHQQGQDSPSPLPFEIEPGAIGDGLDGRRVSTQVEDGWIVGFDQGEFGASTWWFSPDGKRR